MDDASWASDPDSRIPAGSGDLSEVPEGARHLTRVAGNDIVASATLAAQSWGTLKTKFSCPKSGSLCVHPARGFLVAVSTTWMVRLTASVLSNAPHRRPLASLS